MKQIRIFFYLPVSHKMLFAEALLWVFMAKIVLLFLPLNQCVGLIANKPYKAEKPSLEQLKQLKKAIHQTRCFVFWKNQCLVMSLASRWMLQRRQIPSALWLGVAFDGNKTLIAHAWLTTNNFAIVEKNGNYYELCCF